MLKNNNMTELRNIKLDLLMGNQNPVVDLFRKITDGLSIISCRVYNNDGFEFIYYNQSNEWIFYQDAKKGLFWCCKERYWTLFSDELSLKYNEIQEVTKYLVEETLKIELSTTHPSGLVFPFRVEETLKIELSTTESLDKLDISEVEETPKIDCSPVYRPKWNRHLVEETLKRELSTK